jgi:hypothetical protein
MKCVHRTQAVSAESRAIENTVGTQLLPKKNSAGGYQLSPVRIPTVNAHIVFGVLMHIRWVESRRRHHAYDSLARVVQEERRGATADSLGKMFEEYRPRCGLGGGGVDLRNQLEDIPFMSHRGTPM